MSSCRRVAPQSLSSNIRSTRHAQMPDRTRYCISYYMDPQYVPHAAAQQRAAAVQQCLRPTLHTTVRRFQHVGALLFSHPFPHRAPRVARPSPNPSPSPSLSPCRAARNAITFTNHEFRKEGVCNARSMYVSYAPHYAETRNSKPEAVA